MEFLEFEGEKYISTELIRFISKYANFSANKLVKSILFTTKKTLSVRWRNGGCAVRKLINTKVYLYCGCLTHSVIQPGRVSFGQQRVRKHAVKGGPDSSENKYFYVILQAVSIIQPN